ncbi:response regulator transcription factor [Verrucomicrobiaceae bacterium N1E253]|uniref:Response regulator transcription factor n=1 Tax=Oceaniferula marina TaxID=2748318 RepID=A0A851GL55_9BACT|nr:response regulator transcription factor [Oceaniferula marina]NWK55817.1 response regulator transcription factor [Oceaniferula marina]
MKVLLAEDDDLTRETLTEILQEEGYQVMAACDGHEALDLWGVDQPDIVLLDIMMPDLSGYDVCRQIRKLDVNIPVIFVSAKSEEIDVVVGLELGADDFLRKPFGKQELLARIRALLRRVTVTPESPMFHYGEWVVWITQLRATWGEREVDLTPREVRILQMLHKHSPKAVSRDAILNDCWGMDYFPESRTLDQHISNLRKKLGDRWIETVRGVGYQYGS